MEEGGEGVDEGDAKGVLAGDQAAREHAPGSLAVADALATGKRIDGIGQLHAPIDYACHQGIRQDDAAGLAEGRQATVVGDIRPVLEKDQAAVSFRDDIEAALETYEVLPRLILPASEGDKGFGALAGSGHGFLAREGRVPDAAGNVDTANFQWFGNTQARADEVQDLAHGV
jgi:hypothetical protein